VVERRIELLIHDESGTPPSDSLPPFITNESPIPSSTGNDVGVNISFLLRDLLSGVVLGATTITIDTGSGFQPAFQSGLFVAPFNGPGSYVIASGLLDYEFVIDPVGSLPEVTNVQIRVQAEDNEGNALDQTWGFETTDLTIPVLINLNPPSGAANISKSTNIELRIDGGSGSAIDLSTVVIQVQRNFATPVVAYSGGSIQPGFSGGETLSGNGYDFDLNPDFNFADGSTITVFVFAQDLVGNTLNTSYSFSTVSEVFLANNGGEFFEIEDFITPGQYIVHIGAQGDASDPVAYNGIPGSGGKIVTFRDVGDGRAKGSIWTPVLGVGGPWKIYLEQVGSGPAGLVTTVNFQTVPHAYRNRVHSLRSILPSYWKVGSRNIGQRRYPQP